MAAAANLHLHLTGSMRPATLAELAARDGLPLPTPLHPASPTRGTPSRNATTWPAGAHRIGHGITAAADPATLGLLAERQVTVELCPTSYPPLGVVPPLAGIPLRAFLDAGVPMALGTDDPLLFGGSLADQYAIARDHLGCSDTEAAALAAASVSVAAPNLNGSGLRLSHESG